MPIFDLECQRCGKVFEYSVSDDDPVFCPVCNNKNCEKVFIKAPSHTVKGGHNAHYHTYGPYEYKSKK